MHVVDGESEVVCVAFDDHVVPQEVVEPQPRGGRQLALTGAQVDPNLQGDGRRSGPIAGRRPGDNLMIEKVRKSLLSNG